MDDTSLCFINVHLAAGQSQKAARNADIGGILEEKAIFPPIMGDRELAFEHGGDGTAILDHEMVVLNGDLNVCIGYCKQGPDNLVVSYRSTSGDCPIGYSVE